MSSPISRVMRSATLVLPLPGKPNKKIDAAELMAGPISLNTSARDDQILERPLDGPAGDDEVLDRLGQHRFDVIVERHRARADVVRLVERILHGQPAFGRLDFVFEPRVALALLADDVDQPLLAHRRQERREHRVIESQSRCRFPCRSNARGCRCL